MLGDFSLPMDDVEPALHRERVAALLTRGYEAVASVHTATGRLSEADRCSFVPLSAAALAASAPDAKRILALRSGATATAASASATFGTTATPSAGAAAPSCHLRQLSRLHFVAADSVQAAQLGGSEEVVRGYDLVSIAPKNERVLHQACASLDVDIVVLELSQRMALRLRPPAVKAALRRGVFFEICYAPGLREPTARRNLFCNAQALVRATRGRNILLSSSARSAFEVRSPLELLHMATLLGLTKQQAQDAIRLAPRAVLAHAAARLAGKGAAAVGVAAATATTTARAGAGGGPAAASAAADVEMQDAPLPEDEGQQGAAPEGRKTQQQQRAPGSRGTARKRTGGAS